MESIDPEPTLLTKTPSMVQEEQKSEELLTPEIKADLDALV